MARQARRKFDWIWAGIEKVLGPWSFPRSLLLGTSTTTTTTTIKRRTREGGVDLEVVVYCSKWDGNKKRSWGPQLLCFCFWFGWFILWHEWAVFPLGRQMITMAMRWNLFVNGSKKILLWKWLAQTTCYIRLKQLAFHLDGLGIFLLPRLLSVVVVVVVGSWPLADVVWDVIEIMKTCGLVRESKPIREKNWRRRRETRTATGV